MSYVIQWRRDTAGNWTANNPVLAQDEIGIETDTDKAKLGDGATAWTALGYWPPGGAVSSVFGRTGAVAAASGDYAAAQVTGAATAASVTAETSRAVAAEALLAPKASPALTGTPTAPTASALSGSTQLATTAYADSAVAAAAPSSGSPLALARGGTGAATASGALGGMNGAAKPQAGDLILYVSKNGSDASDGLSWGTAKLTIGASFAALPNGGTLHCGAGTWYEAGLVPPSNLIMHGTGGGQVSPGRTYLCASAAPGFPSGDLFSVPASWANASFDGICFQNALNSGGGHVFNGATSSCSGLTFTNCVFIQWGTATCIWYTTNATLINCSWKNCWSYHEPAATVPSWWLISSGGGLESLTWENIWHNGTGNYAIHIESTSSTTYSQGHVFRNITWEECTGGFIRLLSARCCELDNLIAYDNSAQFQTITQDGYVFGRSPAASLSCWGISLSNVHRLAGTLAIRTDTAACSTASGSAAVVNTAAQASDLNMAIAGAGIPAGATITAVTAGTGYTISAPATATASGLTFTVTSAGSAQNLGNQVYSAATCATTSGSTAVADTNAVTADIWRPVAGPGIPAGATITAVTPGTGYTISAPATATASGVTLGVHLAVDIRFKSAVRSQISGSSGIVDLGGNDILTYNMGGVAGAASMVNRSPQGSMDITPSSGAMLSPGFSASGLTAGTSAGGRWAGSTVSGPPVTGTYLTGDWVSTQAGPYQVCTAGGTPGTWYQVGGSKRVTTLTAVSGTYTPDAATTDIALIASPAAAFTIANPSGSPADGQGLIVRITSGSTAYAPTWGTGYEGSASAGLPSAVTVSATDYMGFQWNAASSTWQMLAYTPGFS